MGKRLKRILLWWHLSFALIAFFFAGSYLRLAWGTGVLSWDAFKGAFWLVLAVFMAGPDIWAMGRSRMGRQG